MKKTNSTPIRHWEIAEHLENAIKSGIFPIDGFLPTEEKLCVQFKASRHSVRQALGYLSMIGLIKRKPRAGSQVIATTSIPQLTQSVASIQELLNYPDDMARKIILTRHVQTDKKLANVLECTLGESWFQIQFLRYPVGSNSPICITDLYILSQYADVVKHKNHHSIPIADQISDLFGVTADATQINITASILSTAQASQLNAKKGGAALTVTRRYLSKDNQLFQVAFSVHPAERYTYNFNFKRELPTKSPQSIRL